MSWRFEQRIGPKALAKETCMGLRALLTLNLRPLGEMLNLCGLRSCPFENGGQSLRCGPNRVLVV